MTPTCKAVELPPVTSITNRLATEVQRKIHKSGVGNPNYKKMAAFKSIVMDTVRPGDLIDITLKLIELAKTGEQWAVKELLNRVLGRPMTPLDLTSQGEGLLDSEHAKAVLQTILSEK